ncbi:MAG: DNA mismatch repair endonuclease MutL [Acidobacteriota bacterium]|nr:DNA mismatch repair endonuclease MutL [Acidobacteriota bacterium]MDH3529085.1 DNA mismatch repair endonuclease MutL [Acidobacteriota bacterium]
MPRIKKLPQNLANQIAAGEVVERPASVIKELVENSIDAKSRRISIEIEMGGRRLMKISDDGIGIRRHDAELAFSRHATSKLSDLNDLESITTLGFRGEALASIAAVSKVELVSKTTDEELAVMVKNSESGFEVSDAARPAGTTIAVRDLFYNTPARRKFLRSQPTENYHIASIVTHYALANPEIAFVLTNNGRETLRASPARSLKERAYQLFGRELIESLIPVSGGSGSFLEVTGFVSAPRERRTSRDGQYFFINGRYVKDRVISKGLSEGYRSVLPHGVYPVAFLFLSLPPEEVDVNVHPAKTEVRFRRAEAVKEIVSITVKSALGHAGMGRYESADRASDSNQTSGLQSSDQAHAVSKAAAAPQPITPAEQPGLPVESFPEAPFSTGPRENEDQLREERAHSTDEWEAAIGSAVEIEDSPASERDILPPLDSAISIPQEVQPESVDAGKIRPIGQLHESFIIASDEKGLLLIDQHVAHERILFDYFRNRDEKRRPESQNLLIPEVMDLNPAQQEAFGELLEELESYGFRVAKMSGGSIAIQSVPGAIPAGDARNLFSEILETVDTTRRGDANNSVRDQIAASMACKAAVKINMKLTDEKMAWMIENLLKTSSPSTCPHGRPVILRLTMKDIERRFHRT